MKLYEYNEMLDTLLNTDEDGVDKDTGVVFDPALLDRLEMERNEKIESLLLYAAQLTADADDIAEYVAKLNARAKAKNTKAASIKEWLCSEINRYGDKRFETQRIKAVISTRSKVNIIDIDLLPEKYIRVKTETTPDKTAIGAAIKAGETISGAELVESKSLQIK